MSSPRTSALHPTLLALTSLLALALPAAASGEDPEHPGHGGGEPGNGTQPESFDADGVHLLSWMPMNEFGPQHTSGNDCWGYTSPSGREYALLGLSDGTAFVEVTDPGQPQLVGEIGGPSSLWHDVKVYQDHAYVVSENGGGVQVIDMGSIDSGTVTLVNTVGSPGTSDTHNLAIDEVSGFLYRTGGGATNDNVGLRAYDLSNPASPSFVGQWNAHYVHDAQVVTYTSGPLAGKQYAFAATNGNVTAGMDVVDVTDKSNMQSIGRVVHSNPQFAHQVWLSPDLQYAYLNDELDENGVFPSTNYVIDVSTPSTPLQVASFNNGNTAITHNLYTLGNLIYQANYTSGLRIFDATNPLAVTEVAWFDTYPDNDVPSFDSLWSVYPYFPSGIVVGSDMQKGLFVWWIGAPKLDFDFHAGLPEYLSPGGDSVDLHLHELTPGDLQAGTPALHYDVGAGPVSAPLVHLGGEDYRIDFPAVACGEHVDWYLSAETVDGITWTSPAGGGVFTHHATSAVTATSVLFDDMEANSGWSATIQGGSSTGLWERVDPLGTAAAPEDDHTPDPGTDCFVTGQGSPGGGVGDDDVDGGPTTLTSPLLDLSNLTEPQIRYWRWYKNNGNATVDDVFTVDVSDDDGGSWTNVETLGPTGIDSNGGWIQHSFLVSDFVTPTSQVRVRFVASDDPNNSIVEAAIDDFEVLDLVCEAATTYCTGKTSSLGCTPFITFTGIPSETDTDPFRILATDVVPDQFGLLVYGLDGAANLNFHNGKLCVKSPLVRLLPVKTTGSNGSGACASGQLLRNFNNHIQSGNDPALVSGQQVNAQWFYRDPGVDSFGDGLTDGIEFVVLP